MSNSIIIVDDDEIFCEVLSDALEKRNYKCLRAHSLKQTEEIIHNKSLDYGIVDLRIGNDSGLKVCQFLLAQFPDISIVVLTGFSSIATAVEAIKLGVIQYLTKPTDIDTLLNALTLNDADVDVSISNKPLSVKRLEWEHLNSVLAENNGNITQAAKKLNMHRRTLQRKLQKKPVQESKL